MRDVRKLAAVKDALAIGRLSEDLGNGIIRVPTDGNLDSDAMEFLEPGTEGTAQLEEELISF